MRRFILSDILITILLLFVASCSDLHEENSNNSNVTNSVKDILGDAIKEWGVSSEYLESAMSGYNLVYETGDILQFNVPDGNQCITYGLHNGKLCATCIVMPNLSVDFSSLFKGYSYVGELNSSEVYENSSTNTIASLFQPIESDSDFCAIGFAPIFSDAYQKAEPIIVTTGDANINISSADISGNISGLENDVTVGIVYGMSSDLSDVKEEKIETTSSNKFTLTLKGLMPETTYYYYAYAIVDDLYYQGETKSFKTLPFTYNIDGNNYKMIKVEGLHSSPFYIMETEILPNSDFIVGDNNIGKLNIKEDGAIFYSEFRNFLDNLREATGLPFRLPTKEEWMFAASGGSNSSGYTYSGSNNIDDVAWYKNNCNGIQKIATKHPNELGLYDMSGNYAELCNESDDLYYVDGPICGGSWKDISENCKASSWKNGSTTGSIPGTTAVEKNAYDASYITIRLVYSIQE